MVILNTGHIKQELSSITNKTFHLCLSKINISYIQQINSLKGEMTREKFILFWTHYAKTSLSREAVMLIRVEDDGQQQGGWIQLQW